MKEINAWCLDVGDARIAAIGVGHLRHLVAKPELFEIPQTPAGCGRVFVWNDAIIPVWDVPRSLGVTREFTEANVLAVVAFQLQRDAPTQIAGIALTGPPVRINVVEPTSCALPDPARVWKRIASSCFRNGDQVLPVLDFAKMFGAATAVPDAPPQRLARSPETAVA
ncbi:MAG: chemotaxis protein CheW [Burkholderiales bacterium]